ncbi:heavy metal translocating P-type ATPase [[Empedobacter] haloabium]|uniref:P-type Zn(2+) transporter n=1 Tax=[Empedobacter] haloabium TaxID=592317 RepID=A0ABZ1UUR0_9BURK
MSDMKPDSCAASACACTAGTSVPLRELSSGGERVTYRIPNMDCPSEEALIRKRLAGIDEVLDLRFNLMGRTLDVVHNLPSVDPITTALREIGMKAALLDEQDPATPAEEPVRLTGRQKLALVLAGVSAAAAEAIVWMGTPENSSQVIALAVLSILLAGLPTLRKGWVALRTLTLNINFLMCLAVLGAIVIGQWPEAAMVIFLFAIAELIEGLSLDRARNSVRGLLALAPEEANVQGADGQWHVTAADQIAVGAVVQVKPGERIAVDGEVMDGQSSVNQAPITGESMPVAKQPGDSVYAGTINEQGALQIRVTAQRGDSTLAKIVRVIEETQRNQAPTQRFVDSFARYYTPAVVVAAILVALLPPLLWQQPFQVWLYKSLVMLVIACPCALVISTPVTVVSGLTAAARHGILIKGGQFLEAGHRLKAIALDKTGTLTQGRPAVVEVIAMPGATREQVLAIAASLDANSDHPLARAIVAALPQGETPQRVDRFEALSGRGVRGTIGGVSYYLGNARLLSDINVGTNDVHAALSAQQEHARTAIFLATESQVLGVIGIADVLRPNAGQAVTKLRELGVVAVMLTGDNVATAQQIGKETGIEQIRADMLPDHKLAAIEELETTYGPVGMIGDGINDAPALARATVGFAMGAAGSDTAIETADVALMDDDLGKLAGFIELSRFTRRVLIQNIVLALGIKLVFFVLALLGLATLWMAVFADVGASLLVVFNGLRLLRSTGKGQVGQA